MARKKTRKSVKKRILRFVWKTAAWFAALSIIVVLVFRFVPVYATPLMLIRLLEQVSAGEELHLQHQWVPLQAISDNLVVAVISSEDQNFLDHYGLDFEAIKGAIKAYLEKEKGEKRLRGASTISQQTAKNVFLWPHRSWIRKTLEVYFTILIEILWSKERIIEVYLNSIEMGKGVYGAEAASHHHFNKSAAGLTKREAAAIAAILPNPREYKVNPPSPYIRSRIDWITSQMHRLGPLQLN